MSIPGFHLKGNIEFQGGGVVRMYNEKDGIRKAVKQLVHQLFTETS